MHPASPRKPGTLAVCLVLLTFPLAMGCGEGWDAYRDQYAVTPGDLPGEPWTGEETVFVVRGEETVETPLAGIETSDFLGVGAVRLSDLILASAITEDPEGYRYDFTATDDYNLLRKRGGDRSLLPSWENMQTGFLYATPFGDLETGWSEHPWGSAVSAYNVKFMNGGAIELLDP